MIVLPTQLLTAALFVHRSAVFIYFDAQAAARGGARCASQVLDRCAGPLPAAPLVVRCKYMICKYMIVVPRQLPTLALVVHRSAVFIYVGAQAAACGGARCALQIRSRGAQEVAHARVAVLILLAVASLRLLGAAAAINPWRSHERPLRRQHFPPRFCVFFVFSTEIRSGPRGGCQSPRTRSLNCFFFV
jgi:hypothetical protein